MKHTITPQLSITDIDTVKEQSTAEFDHVVSVCEDDIESHLDDSVDEYDQIELADGPCGTYFGVECNFDLFETATDTIRSALEADQSALVHCHAGASRSVVTSATALATIREQPLIEALETIEDVIPHTHPANSLQKYGQCYVFKHTGQPPVVETLPKGRVDGYAEPEISLPPVDEERR